MSLRKRRKTEAPPIEQVAGNGLLDRRALLRGGAMVAGAMTTGAALNSAAAEPLQNDQWSLEMGTIVPPYQVSSRFEKDVVRTLSNPKHEFRNSHARTPHHLLQRHGNAQRPVLHHCAYRTAGHRPGTAQARHPRPGEAAAGLHRRLAGALPDGDPHAFRRVQRQQRADVLERADAGHRAGAARAGLQRRMDRRAALDLAGGDRHRPEGEVAAGRRRRCLRLASQRADQEGIGRRDDRALPERRAHPARQRLSDAPAVARLSGQHERQASCDGSS